MWGGRRHMCLSMYADANIHIYTCTYVFTYIYIHTQCFICIYTCLTPQAGKSLRMCTYTNSFMHVLYQCTFSCCNYILQVYVYV